MYKVGFHTLGCKVNQYETEGMMSQFEEKGYKIVDFSDFADIYVINTCIVTNVAEKKSRQMISKAKKLNKDGIIVVVGCYAQNAEKKIKDNLDVDIIIGNTKKSEVLGLVTQYMVNHKKLTMVEGISDYTDYEEMIHVTTHDKTRAYIKIQDGCNQFCSYCIIPFVRGRVRSRAKASIITEVSQLVKNGYKEIVITGIHIASYGVDLKDCSLIELLEELEGVQGLSRIRIGSFDPTIVTEDFVNRIKGLSKICPHFHLSLQSGCDETLKRMNRRYTTTDYYNSVLRLRKSYDKPAITTDIIVGFPGETEEEFNETVSFVKKVAFSDIHVFKYSVRAGTKAAIMPNQVLTQEKQRRSNFLIGLRNQLHTEYLKKFLNQEIEMLCEELIVKNGKEYYNGYTDNYLKVIVPDSNHCYSNQLIGIVTTEIEGDYLLGDVINK